MRIPRYAQSFEVVAELPSHLESLRKLACNFRWTWDQETQDLFQEVDAQLWEEVEHNPQRLLRQLSQDRIERLGTDHLFLSKLKHCLESLEAYQSAETWFQQSHPDKVEGFKVAYFCAEFGLNECLPIYSGGLGLLAGDHLKAASDLGVPLVGVGLLYSRGYFRQFLNDEGWQQEHYPTSDFYNLPLELIRGEDDQPVHINIEFPDRLIHVQIWKAVVGRIELYLLDSNLLMNRKEDQGITDTLYGGDENMRIRQEMVLGIGGLRALEHMGIKPTVCHMNEGHAAFMTVERLRQFMEDTQCDLQTARQVTVAGNVFTTHTPVPAGFDVFPIDMVERYMSASIKQVGFDFKQFVKMGQPPQAQDSTHFNMAYLAMENSNFVNGVSRLHAEVSRELFQDRWPDFPVQEVPIEAVTNGVHTPSWIGPRMVEVLDRHVGPAWRDDPSGIDTWRKVAQLPDEILWEVREDQRADLVRFCRKRGMRSVARRKGGRQAMVAANNVLDPRVLTVGFARRFATYKRAFLLFSDRERLRSILNHPERPVQFIFAGKSHPRDDGGKKLIQDIVNFIKAESESRIVFVEDYDIEVARNMVQGVDLWLNNPRRPMEASGTSGMKVIPNGGLNCSILDGWWAEGYQPGQGWAIGDGREDPDEGRQDWMDAQALYQLLEQDIAPLFYARNEAGIPVGWLNVVRQSMENLAPRFSTSRMVREYTQRLYVPAGEAYRRLQEDGLGRAQDAFAWRKRVRDAWPEVKVLNVRQTAHAKAKVGDEIEIVAQVSLGNLAPSEVKVQVLVGKVGPNRELIDYYPEEMHHVNQEGSVHTYQFKVGCAWPGLHGFVCRIIPHHVDVHVASELPLIAWQADSQA